MTILKQNLVNGKKSSKIIGIHQKTLHVCEKNDKFGQLNKKF